ncbi:uncharacterized protein LOC131624562 [Vicia villosa]|uniref:uncharacterized protein LOC131624562 n=1 Tax=Vicia villosa TaxID=3911 RepID=UPI00273BFD4B|nr:uncharacterized protein LOC131624562 [Vicia villosa]
MWKPRKKGFTIGRLIWVPPSTGELYYLRMMLTVVKGPTTYEEIRKVGDRQYDSFRDACFAIGFLEDDREYIGAIKEASEWGSGHYLRKLFVVMLLSGNVNRPVFAVTILILTQQQLVNLTLMEIEKLLQLNRRSLRDFKPIPYLDDYVLEKLGNHLIYEERSYDIEAMKAEFQYLHAALTGCCHVVVFGGDFRKILPVIPRGTRSDIIHATINASYIWHSVQVLTLTKNMRLTSGTSEHGRKELADFSDWLLRVGEGRLGGPNDGAAKIEFPQEMLIKQFEDSIVGIVTRTYPEFLSNYHDYGYLKCRAILASTINMVDKINNHVLAMMPGNLRDYYSCNTVDRSEIHDRDMLDVLTPEFLSSLNTPGMPNHHINLKIGAPVMLMRNIDQSEGLCNGTRLTVTKMVSYVLEAHIMGGKHHGNVVYIPWMDMTINKSQGRSLDWVGLYIPRDVFTHGKIYVALLRVTSKKGVKVLIHDDKNTAKTSTANVVYKEVFNNI